MLHSESEIIVVELSPLQTLTGLCRALLAAEININSAYPLMVRPHGTTTISIHTDDQVIADQLIEQKQFGLLDEYELYDDSKFGDSQDEYEG